MRLTPREMERLLIFTTAELARKHRARGLKLNHPEAVALLCDEIIEGARAGGSLSDVRAAAYQVLSDPDAGVRVVAALALGDLGENARRPCPRCS